MFKPPAVSLLVLLIAFCAGFTSACARPAAALQLFPANDPHIRYMGRIDMSDPLLPRFWQPGVTVEFSFIGDSCAIIVNDQVLWGNKHNYIEVVVDGVAVRSRLDHSRDTIHVAGNKNGSMHRVLLMKNTEANIGYIELVAVLANSLSELPPPPARRIEFIGNSITCGASSDVSSVPCGKGVWEDQHNAWLSYGASTARSLSAAFHLSSVSGIGLMHSCCGMDVVMPPVFDKIDMRGDSIRWDFSRFQPDVVTICLGQNDGIQDSTTFVKYYIKFVKQLRAVYPHAQLVCLSSPMADPALKTFMTKCIDAVVSVSRGSGDLRVSSFIFSKTYSHGCDYHPDLADHEQIATELTDYLKTITQWK